MRTTSRNLFFRRPLQVAVLVSSAVLLLFSSLTCAAVPGAFTLSNAAPVWDATIPGPKVNLTWGASSGATSYDLYRNGSLYSPGITQLSFLNCANLVSGQTYSYYVVAKNTAGTRQSNSINVGPMPGQPVVPVTLTLYVHSGSATGPALSGALVTGTDAAGQSFNQTTGAAGYVTITGTAGTWQFTASKSGYTANSWGQSITTTGQRDAFLTATVVPVTLTLYVHSGSATGPVLSGTLVTGTDAAGQSFGQTTGPAGYVTITGAAGAWQFTASKSGYTANSWGQSITATGRRDAFLTSTVTPAPSISSVSPSSMSADNNLHSLKVFGSNFATSGAHLLFTDPQGNSYTSAAYPSREGPITATEFDYQFNNASDAGTWWVKVQNSDGQTSGAVSFTVNAPAASAPSISNVSPNPVTADAGNAAQTLTITGANFVNKPTVILTWTGQSGYTLSASAVTFVSNSQLTISLHLGAVADNWTVKVVNPDTQASNVVGFQAVAAVVSDDYPYRGSQIDVADRWGFLTRECTSYVAWRMNRDAGTTGTNPPFAFSNYMMSGHWGNASNWASNGQTLGFTVDSTPTVGSIAWFNYGHVAYVESVNADGSVNVSEYNYHLDHNYNTRSNVRASSYIHVNVAPSGGAVDYPGATWIAAGPLHFTTASRGRTDVTSIVIHTTEDAFYGAAIAWFQNTTDPSANTSAHYLVQRNGNVVQLVRESNMAHHAGVWLWNQHSIGIEVERLANTTEAITSAQYGSVKALVDSIRTRFNVPLVFPTSGPLASPTVIVDGIVGHGKVVTNGVDPVNWDWNYFKSLFGVNPPVQTGSLQVGISPPGAVSAGAQWRVDNGAWQTIGSTVTNLPAGSHTVSFCAVTGWIAPANLSVTIRSGQTTTASVNYAAKAQILTPTLGTTLTSPTTVLAWNSGINVTTYALWAGSAAGNYDITALYVGTNLTQQLTLPATGAPVYVRLWSQISSLWQSNDYSYITPSPVKAAMISPINGVTNRSGAMTFTWDAGVGASRYALWVGSASNSYDLHALAVGTNQSQTLTLPVDGRLLYVRLWSLINGDWPSLAQWQYTDYSYRAFNAVKARFAGLANGTTLRSANPTLTWDAGVGASQYALWVGSAPGGYDLYAANLSTNLSQALTLPSDGRRLYVRLWSLINGVWKFNSYELGAWTAPAAAQMLSPTPGTTNSSASVMFNWSSGTGVSQYAMWVGSVPGDYDLYALPLGTNLTRTLTLPTDGSPVYVRLWSLIGGVWDHNDYTYGSTYAGGAAKAQMLTPTNGTTLSGASTTFTWSSGSGVNQYAMWVGSTPGSYDLYAVALGTNLTQTVTVPVDGGPVYVRLWSFLSGVWKFNDYFYMAFLAP